ncbi:tail fiber domain-containing protein [Burkholderia cenocepacia]|nr:tail fiber domain-containing protein [Burkholderia cenocepacia]
MGVGGKVIKFPLASSVSVNACLHFFNVSEPVTIAMQGNDGTQVTLLNKGDWATYVSDGDRFWHVAARGRMLWNETVGGDLTVGGNLTVTRDETVGGNLTVNGRVFVPEGTAKAPGLAFQNDGAPDTGFFHVSDGVFGVTCNTQEVVRYGPGAVSYTVRPTFGGKVPWDAGNFNPADYAKLTGADFLSRVSAARAPSTGDIGQSLFLANGLANDARIGLVSYNWESAVQLRCSVNMQVDAVNLDATQWGKFAAAAFNIASDRAFKKDIRPLADGLDKVLRLAGVYYADVHTGAANIGLIAQDVQDVFPEVVNVIDTEGHLAIDYAKLVGPLIEAVKTLTARVAALEEAAST